MNRLTDKLSVRPQMNAADIRDAAANGFAAIVNNRPDGEEPDQPSSETLAAAAQEAGLAYHHIPVTGDGIGDDDVARFARAVADADGPVAAFCRTGTRSATLWALGEVQKRPVYAVLKDAQAAGYDLGAHRARMNAVSGGSDK